MLKTLTAAIPVALLAGVTAAYAVPANDDISGAVLLTGSGTYSENVAGATPSGAPPGPYGVVDNDVWFTFFGSGGTAMLSTSNPGTNYDTQFWAYSGYDGSNLSSLTILGYDDDSGFDTTSQLSFSTTAGTQYWFIVDGFSGDSGTFNLSYSGLGVGAVPVPASGVLLAGAMIAGGIASRRKKRA